MVFNLLTLHRKSDAQPVVTPRAAVACLSVGQRVYGACRDSDVSCLLIVLLKW